MLSNNFFLPPPFVRRPRQNYVPANYVSQNSISRPQIFDNFNTTTTKNTKKPEPSFKSETKHQSEKQNNDRNFLANLKQSEEALFEIFGLKIYFDDLLLICIIFFLYQEGIQDEYLFIALILLLLS